MQEYQSKLFFLHRAHFRNRTENAPRPENPIDDTERPGLENLETQLSER
jgi:hypothetical protein